MRFFVPVHPFISGAFLGALTAALASGCAAPALPASSGLHPTGPESEKTASSQTDYAIPSAVIAAVDTLHSPEKSPPARDGHRIYGQCLSRASADSADTPCPVTVLVLVQSGDVEISRTRTDHRGEFSFAAAVGQRYQVRAGSAGYQARVEPASGVAIGDPVIVHLAPRAK